MAKRKKLAERQLLVNKFLHFQGTMKDYCIQNNINYRTFRGWRYKINGNHLQSTSVEELKLPKQNVKKERSKFIKFALPIPETIKVLLPNGIRLEFIPKNLSTAIKELASVI